MSASIPKPVPSMPKDCLPIRRVEQCMCAVRVSVVQCVGGLLGCVLNYHTNVCVYALTDFMFECSQVRHSLG